MKTESRELFVDDHESFLPDKNFEQGVDKGVEGETVV